MLGVVAAGVPSYLWRFETVARRSARSGLVLGSARSDTRSRSAASTGCQWCSRSAVAGRAERARLPRRGRTRAAARPALRLRRVRVVGLHARLHQGRAAAPVLEVLSHRIVWAFLLLLVIVWRRGELADAPGRVAPARDARRAGRVHHRHRGQLARLHLGGRRAATCWRAASATSSTRWSTCCSGWCSCSERLQPRAGARRRSPAPASGCSGWRCAGPRAVDRADAGDVFALYGLLRKIVPVGALVGLHGRDGAPGPARRLATCSGCGASGTPRSVRPTGARRAAAAGRRRHRDAAAVLRRRRRGGCRFRRSASCSTSSPTLQFLLAVLVYREPLDGPRARRVRADLDGARDLRGAHGPRRRRAAGSGRDTKRVAVQDLGPRTRGRRPRARPRSGRAAAAGRARLRSRRLRRGGPGPPRRRRRPGRRSRRTACRRASTGDRPRQGPREGDPLLQGRVSA